MTRRMDFRKDRKRQTVVEQGYESWDGSAVADGLGKQVRTTYDPHSRARSTRVNADSKRRDKKKAASKAKVSRISPNSAEGKKISADALRADQKRSSLPSVREDASPIRIRPVNAGSSLASLAAPRISSVESTTDGEMNASYVVAMNALPLSSATHQRYVASTQSRKWIIWVVIFTLAVALYWGFR